MSFLQSLFAGAKMILKGLVHVAADVVRVVLNEVDKSAIGRAATDVLRGTAERINNRAYDLANEERELALKRQRDGRNSDNDLERLQEIEVERKRLRQELDAANKKTAAEDMRNAQAEVVSAPVTDDEASASVGILASKECPACGGTMRIRQGALNSVNGRRSFYWQCTAQSSLPCSTIKLDPHAEKAAIIRKPDPDLDGPQSKRREIWQQRALLAKTHGRLRSALGEADEQVICPHHLLPMKLMPKARADGLMLSSYEYVCLGVMKDGRACAHKHEVSSFPQVAAALRRREGVGIIDS